jgi:hypothetical protein
MSELERLIEIARELPEAKIHALLTVAEQMTGGLSEDDFLRKINAAPSLDVDEETAGELRVALSERGETLSHEELRRQLGLG